MDVVTPGPGGWGLNVGKFVDAHPDWLIRGGTSGFGWTAQRRDASGRPRGPALRARTLDELDALIQAASRDYPAHWDHQRGS
jgi:hypothetical protein